MRFESGVIFVLFVDQKAARLCAMAMYQVHRTARFFPRFLRQLRKYRSNFRFTSCFSDPGYRQHDHLLAPLLRPALAVSDGIQLFGERIRKHCFVAPRSG